MVSTRRDRHENAHAHAQNASREGGMRDAGLKKPIRLDPRLSAIVE